MSGFFEWDNGKYGLDVREMDAEHQKLIALMNTLRVLYEKHAGAAELGEALGELATYTAKHFADEEAYMTKIEYPELRVHAGVHAQLRVFDLRHVRLFIGEVLGGISRQLTQRLTQLRGASVLFIQNAQGVHQGDEFLVFGVHLPHVQAVFAVVPFKEAAHGCLPA